MATVEQLPHAHNGIAHSGEEIAVENPATGQTAGTVPDLGAAAVSEMARRARIAQPAWEAYGFEGRGRILSRAQKWLMDNAEQRDRDDHLGDRQDLRGRLARGDRLRRQRLRVLGQERPRVPRRRARQVRPAARQGQEAHPALPPAGADRRDRPVELPADELLRRLHPRARGRQQRDPQALRGHAPDLAADGRGAARVRAARRRAADRHRPRRDRRGARRGGGHDHVHRLHPHRAQGRRSRRASA